MTKNKSRLWILLAIAMHVSTMSFAQSIHFNYTDGTNASYNLEDVRKITFNADEMNLHLFDGSVYAWDLSTIAYYQYDDASLNVEEWLNYANAWDVKIFPNPTSSTLTIRFNLLQSDELSIGLYDMQGKPILTKNLGKKETIVHEETLDLSNVPSGTYFCRISGQKNTITKRLIKH